MGLEDPLPRELTHLDVGRMFPCLDPPASLEGFFSAHDMATSLPQREGSERKQARSHNVFYDRALEVTRCRICNSLLVSQFIMVKGAHKSMNTKE